MGQKKRGERKGGKLNKGMRCSPPKKERRVNMGSQKSIFKTEKGEEERRGGGPNKGRVQR